MVGAEVTMLLLIRDIGYLNEFDNIIYFNDNPWESERTKAINTLRGAGMPAKAGRSTNSMQGSLQMCESMLIRFPNCPSRRGCRHVVGR